MNEQQLAAVKQALEALKKTQSEGYNLPGTAIEEAITALQSIISQDALDKKAENARELGLDYEPAVQEGRDWSLLEATQESLREHMAEIKRLKAAQPAPLQETKELFGYEIWNRFYRSKEELLEEMVRPKSGYPQDWIEANIREVYVHGTYALAEKGGAS
jgi:hypothetical protein